MTDSSAAALDPAEPGALEALYERHVEEVLDFVVRATRDSGAPDEIAAELVVTGVFEALPAAEPGDPRLTLLALAYRACVDGTGPRREPQWAVRRWEVTRGPAAEATSRLVWGAASTMTVRQYGVLDLAFRRGLTSGELASVLDLTEPQARAQTRRAVEAFRNRVRLLLFRRQRRLCPEIAGLVPRGARRMSPDQQSAVDRHLRGCAQCEPAAQPFTTPTDVFQGLEPVEVPQSLRWWPPQLESVAAAAPIALIEPRKKRRKLRVALTVTTLLALLGGGAAVALWRLQPWVSAPSDASSTAPDAKPVTETFQPSGGLQRFIVPCGVTSIRVVAAGGAGGLAPAGGVPGLGALVGADLPVAPGQQLLIVVGSNGSAPGIGGGGSGLASTSTNGEPGRNLLAAGAGGGGGGDARGVVGSGGAGGDADAPGGHASGPWGGAGGAAATLVVGSAGGAGGAGPAGAGHVGGPGSRDGGLGGGPNGGGGGSGYFSGGGGGGGGNSVDAVGGGGGGGGGSSFVVAGASNVTRLLDILRTPRLTITHSPPTC